ncbi:putative 2' cyclic ADP-D-ribose synthase BdTIR [Apium graveolens]|uniref:putative 2' cyclic ADP-D-ribose synthase BdTIR n=1 Tax=Apium graveolens TaxID=4045 RepID=UPI003D7A7B40
MKPGDKLFEKINGGIMSCKVGVLVFSPTYCNSYFCLHELALMMESRKKVIPIFRDVKPSELRVVDTGSCSQTEMQRPSTLNWSDVVKDAADIVVERLMEAGDEEGLQAGFKQIPSDQKTWI